MKIVIGVLLSSFAFFAQSQELFTVDTSLCDLGKNKSQSRVDYPSASRRNFESGTVVLDVITNSNGCPSTIRVSASSGFIRLDAAVVELVKNSKFKKLNESFPFKYTFTFEGSPFDCINEKRNELVRFEKLNFTEAHIKALQFCTQ